MPYIGNTIRAADDYRLIDDISSSFNGSTTSFALQVAGSAPVPFPKSPQQVLISVNGVIQEPDPSGSSGFNLVGTNIVFSSAPTNGHAFFGIIYATADYLNAGGNFPAGSLGAPSITFIGDENTGLYRKSGGSVGFVSDATEIANTDSNGLTISSGNLILGDSSGANDDRIKLGASGDLSIYHDGSGTYLDNTTGNLELRSNEFRVKSLDGSNEAMIQASYNGNVQLYHDGGKKLETQSAGVEITGKLTFATEGLANGSIDLGIDADLNLYHDNSDAFIDNNTGDFYIRNAGSNPNQIYISGKGGENGIIVNGDGAVELYNDNARKLKTNSTGFQVGTTSARLLIESLTSGDGSQDIARVGLNRDNGSTSDRQLWSQVTVAPTVAKFNVFARTANDTGTAGNFLEIDAPNNNFDLPRDNFKLRIGSGNDLEIFHDGSHSKITNSTGYLVERSNQYKLSNVAEDHTYIKVPTNEGGVELYYDNSKKFETVSGGVDITGGATATGSSAMFKAIESGGATVKIQCGGSEGYIGTQTNHKISFVTNVDGGSNGGRKWEISGAGMFIPYANNAYDIGSTSMRVRNIYTNDLNLSNEGSSNDVDGTWGNYTIQEGAEDLFLINKRNGKKFKFNLTEVS